MAKTIDDYKKDWEKAYKEGNTDAMNAAHAGAEAIRANQGYSGGADGSQYIPINNTPTNKTTTTKTTAPSGFTGSATGVSTYTNDQASIVAKMNANSQAWFGADEATQKALHEENQRLAEQLGDGVSFNEKSGYWSGSAAQPMLPEYSSTRSPQIDSLLDAILNREPFSYDHTTDPTYLAYEQQYKRLGDRAREDTLGDIAGLTGGLPSSWAVSAASQAQNDYNQQLSNIIPTLYDAAYGRYMDEDSLKRNDLGLLLDLEQMDYNRYRDLVGDTQWLKNFETSNEQWDKNFDLSKDQFEWNKTVDDFNMKAQEQTTKFNQMMEKWNMTGVADNEVAAYLGVPVGATTESYYFNKANLALSQAKQAQSQKEASKVETENKYLEDSIARNAMKLINDTESFQTGAQYILSSVSSADEFFAIGSNAGIPNSILQAVFDSFYDQALKDPGDQEETAADYTYYAALMGQQDDPEAWLSANKYSIPSDIIEDLYKLLDY